ncbi:MAG: hypothetical protein CMM32_08470 [Rhodospirillaceae bacterium]|nr:hypothetical protein [Rhodospirillaceae bacterium]
MAVHLIKMAVGIESFSHLAHVQKNRLQDLDKAGEPPLLRHWTRNSPTRAEEICAGGSLYWIIKGAIRARQQISSIDKHTSERSRKRCALVLDPTLVRTELKISRPIQGWRYLDPQAAPKDLLTVADEGNPDIPMEMAKELRELGLL